MEDLHSAYNPKKVEEKWYRIWDEEKYFDANNTSEKEPFCIMMPPPNVTGVLHMGHALGKTLQDILIRSKRMQGFEALWVPGTDHAGISTQTVVEKHLIEQTGKTRKEYPREDFISQIWKWKEDKQMRIIDQIQKLGCSCDWERLRFTMDEKNNLAVKTVFKKMFDEGLIYLGDYLVNWDPATQTALADDEVEHEDIDSFLWYFKYPITGEKDKYITIATTRPETMLGDTAICASPKDKRFESLIGKTVTLPIMNREIPIIKDNFVDPEFGTGLVKITPAHDFNDYEVGLRHNLPQINIMTNDGCINKNGKEFEGMKMLEAREAVVEKMKKLNLLEKVEPHKLRIGVSYRSKAIIEPYLSKQWFVKMSGFKDKLINAVKEKRVEILPSYWEKTYFYWIENLRDWCISRQLWWGHRIPVWYNKKDKSKMICYIGDGNPPEIENEIEDWYQDEDVLDTWFSSALWPFSTLGYPQKTEDLKKFYPTSVLVTGHDILFFWVARMILMGEYVMGEVPFSRTFIHGLIYGKSYWRKANDGSITYASIHEKNKYDLGHSVPEDVYSKWEKMSKSKGNIIDPIEIIDQFGSDAMRIALCSSVTNARQIDIDRRKFEEYKNFANKLWNASRFIFMNLDKKDDLKELTTEDIKNGLNRDLFTLEDKWILSLLNQLVENVNKHLQEYNFDKLASSIYKFFWDEFCAYYLEFSKPYLFGKAGDENIRTNKQKILLIVLLSSIRLLHPITPFITEEIFSLLKNRFDGVSKNDLADPYTKDVIEALLSKYCIVSPFPKLFSKDDVLPKIQDEFSFIEEIIKTCRNIKAEMKIPPSLATDIYFKTDNSTKEILQKNQVLIKTLVKTKDIIFDKDAPKTSACSHIGQTQIFIPLPEDLLQKEKQRLKNQKEKIEKSLHSTKMKLENKSFVEKAPEEIVNKMKDQFSTFEKQLADIEEKLKNL
jgi:valyl-tRNA synthetase